MQQSFQPQSRGSKLLMPVILVVVIIAVIVVAMVIHHGSQSGYPTISNTVNDVSNYL